MKIVFPYDGLMQFAQQTIGEPNFLDAPRRGYASILYFGFTKMKASIIDPSPWKTIICHKLPNGENFVAFNSITLWDNKSIPCGGFTIDTPIPVSTFTDYFCDDHTALTIVEQFPAPKPGRNGHLRETAR